MIADYDGDVGFSNPRVDDLPMNSDNHSFSLDQFGALALAVAGVSP